METPLKTTKLVIGVLTLSVLAACSNPEKRTQANRSFDYQDASLRSGPLMIPAGLEAPNFNNEYVIPKLPADAPKGIIGKNVDVRPPTQVLPLVRGSELLESATGLWFYQQQIDQPLEQQLAQALVAFFEQKKIEYNTTTHGFNSQGASATSAKQDFKWTLMPDSNRRAVAVQVELLDNAKMLAQDKQRAEASILNAFSLSYQRELTQQQQLLDSAPIQVTLDKPQGRLLAAADYERTWKRLMSVLPKLGFELTNRQQALGYVEVKFSGLSKGKWQELNLPKLDIPTQPYRIQLGDLGEQSSITLSDKNKAPVSAGILSQFSVTLTDAFQRTDFIR